MLAGRMGECGRFIASVAPFIALAAVDFAAGGLNPVLEYLAAGEARFSDVSAAQAAAVAAGSVVTGMLTGRMSAGWLLGACVLVSGACNLLTPTAAAASFGALVAVRVGANVVDPWPMALTLLDASGASAVVTGRAVAAVLAGRVVGGLVAGLVVETSNVQTVATVAGVVNVAAALLVFAVVPRSTAEAQALQRNTAPYPTPPEGSEEALLGKEEREEAVEGRGGVEGKGGEGEEEDVETWVLVRAVLGSWGGWGHVAVLFCNGLVCGAFNTFIPASLKDAFHVRPFVVPLVVAGQTAIRSATSALGLPLLAARVREPLLSTLLAVALATALGIVWAAAHWLVPCMVACTLAVSLQSLHNASSLACANAFVVSSNRTVRGVTKGAAFAIFVAGIAVGSFVAQMLWNSSRGLVALFAPLAALMLCCTLLHRSTPIHIAAHPTTPTTAVPPPPHLPAPTILSPARANLTDNTPSLNRSNKSGASFDLDPDAGDEESMLGDRAATPAPDAASFVPTPLVIHPTEDLLDESF
jgi:MFS family permease